MRDRDYFDDEYRDRDYRGPRNSRDIYQSREQQLRDAQRENDYYYDYDRDYRAYDRNFDERRYIDRDRYQPRYEPRTEARYYPPERTEYAERERTRWTGTQNNRSYLRCRDIMTTDLITTTRDANLREVARLMRDKDTGVLPVIDEANHVIGMITDRDIVVRALATIDKPLDACIVQDVMSEHVYSVRPDDRVVDCIRKMGDKQVRRVVVTDDSDRLRGIISMGDIATEAEYDRELSDAIEDISKPKSWFKRLFNF